MGIYSAKTITDVEQNEHLTPEEVETLKNKLYYAIEKSKSPKMISHKKTLTQIKNTEQAGYEMQKVAYTLNEIKAILSEIKTAVAAGELKNYKHSKNLFSSFGPEYGISVAKNRKAGQPDRSIPDLLHEYFHWKLGHGTSGTKNGLAPSVKGVNQEIEATNAALDFMENTKGVKRVDQQDYLIGRTQKYINALNK